MQEVPHLHIAVHSRGEEHGDLGGAPASASQSRRAGLHPHDGRGLEVLTPDLGRGVAYRQEVLRVEGVPGGSHLNNK